MVSEKNKFVVKKIKKYNVKIGFYDNCSFAAFVVFLFSIAGLLSSGKVSAETESLVNQIIEQLSMIGVFVSPMLFTGFLYGKMQSKEIVKDLIDLLDQEEMTETRRK